MTERIKIGLALVVAATICAVAHLWIVTWLVHTIGHGYKWITVLMAVVWLSIFGLLALNMNLNRIRERADEADTNAHVVGRG